jgi:hypothetical protein
MFFEEVKYRYFHVIHFIHVLFHGYFRKVTGSVLLDCRSLYLLVLGPTFTIPVTG